MPRGPHPQHPYDDPPRFAADGPVDLNAFLPGPGPFELELGPGRGAFFLERCLAAPDARLLGLEIRRKWAAVVDARLKKRGLSARARVLCEDARLALPRLGPDATITRIFVHFPDPWWKKRHYKRLLLTPPFIDQLCRLLKDDGELFVQTDVPERAEQYQALLDAADLLTAFGDTSSNPTLANNPYEAFSNREQRAQQDGLPVYRLRYQRQQRVAKSPKPNGKT